MCLPSTISHQLRRNQHVRYHFKTCFAAFAEGLLNCVENQT